MSFLVFPVSLLYKDKHQFFLLICDYPVFTDKLDWIGWPRGSEKLYPSFISEIVPDRAVVTMEGEQETAHKLSNGTSQGYEFVATEVLSLSLLFIDDDDDEGDIDDDDDKTDEQTD